MQSLKLTKADRTTLVQRYFDEYNFVQSNIESFDTFVEWRLQKLIDEIGSATPAVIPPEAEEVKLVFGKIRVEKPSIIEADGAKRKILPVEARTRLLTYAAPVYLEVSLVIDGKERERQEVQICELPIMLKSKLCYLYGLPKEERIVAGEDPYDPGGYFVINGTERTLILLEDLAANNIFVARDKGPITHKANVYSASEQYKIPHLVERTKEGLYLVSFAGNKRVPLFAVLKALGTTKDSEVSGLINLPEVDEDVYINLLHHVDLRTEAAAQDFIGKELGMILPPEQRTERVQHILDNFLLPHVGSKREDRAAKARYLGRIVKKLILLKQKKIKKDVKDHYMNKRVRLSGDLLEDLFRNNLKILVNDMLYIFQRGVRRGKILSITSIVRTKFLSDRIKSALATGNWTANRQGISQRLDRENALATLAHLQRVSSLLEASRESFEARELHPTHWGRLCPLESPEGKHIGLRKNLALLATVTPELKKDEVEENMRMLEQLGLRKFSEETQEPTQKQSDVFFDGRLTGQVENPAHFVSAVRQARRESRLSRFVNVSYNRKLDTVYVVLERNRVVRPLIVIKDGAPAISEEKLKALKEGAIRWSDLLKDGSIEYLDALEEEDALVAINESDITARHTHMEINPVTIFSMTTSMVPYANFNQASKLGKGHKTQKQAMGCYTLSFQNRMDTTVNLLHYPQKPITRSFTQSLLGDELSAGQNLVVAIINWDGYNMKDAVVINRASIERGVGRSSHFRPYVTEKLRYPGGQIDEIRIPEKDVSGYTVEKDYRFLTEDGIVYPEAEVGGGDVVIGKTSPPRFLGKLEAFSTAANIRKDASVRVRYGEGGVVNKVIITESEEGSQLIKVEVRENRLPEIGDKLSSKHGQKGVIGMIASPEDIPFSASGVVPDILFSPNGLPRRLTVGHLIEALSGKVGALAGRYVNGTAFQNEEISDLRKDLVDMGFIENGTETLYDGKTGKEYKAKIFVGNMYYLRLKHQVADKIQVRARGPVTLLTRQPTEGKAKEGGLRLGEMEKDCFVAHGASLLMKERFDSDRTVVWVCEHCGNLAIYDAYKSKAYCLCGEKVRISPIELSYAFKLFLDELKSMHIKPRLILKEKY